MSKILTNPSELRSPVLAVGGGGGGLVDVFVTVKLTVLEPKIEPLALEPL
jgi:hypothetical protein